MTQTLYYRRCHGCGKPAKDVRLLVALIGDIHVCDDCVLTMSAIIANQSHEEARIHFVDEMQQIMREPIEVVAKWKELRAKKQETKESRDAG